MKSLTPKNRPAPMKPYRMIRRRKVFIWLLEGLAVVAVIIGLIDAGLRLHARHLTTQRFADIVHHASMASATVRKDYQAQASVLGISYDEHDIARTCYMNQPIGGGPFVGGPYLWCGVSVNKKISTLPDTAAIDAIIDKLRAVAESEGLSTRSISIQAGYVRTPNYSTGQSITYGASEGNDFDPDGYGCEVTASSNYIPYDAQGGYILNDNPGAIAPKGYFPGTKPATLYYAFKCDGQAAYIPPAYKFVPSL